MSGNIKAEYRRYTILNLLLEDPDYSIDTYLLYELLAELKQGVSNVELMADLRLLSEMGLVTLKEIAGADFATLRGRGVEVAKGISIVPGISRPRPDRG